MVQIQKSEVIGSAEGKVRRDWMAMDRFYRERIEDGQRPSLYIPYQPTDWSKTPKNEDLLDGWDDTKGYCPKCFTLRSCSGACNCG